MSTNSRIGMVQKDGTVKSVYCHWDGYPSNNGAILLKHYTDPEKVKKLIELGDLSYIGKEVEPAEGQKHDFENPAMDVTVAYHRDRGKDLNIRVNHNQDDYFNSDISSYGYLLTLDNVWLYSAKRGATPRILTKEICNIKD